ncbi:MAG TPA: manganese efflux pump MntP family protein [Rectinema sp.]|nr:manganese efflux pump MntP family protein [Spirochaetota bacterium]NLH90674.1 manganese efflux pump [Treponema sp.]OQC74843.1 MAG: putative manganese efflux pump MntP [Spirochaetes bacterium ADurb.Bin001]HNP93847.1 manganese efflux pump MntP family protein [Rectinema sp.]HNT60110.1 manganese efflux pump MntP family protein [Rectinema sp.]
MLTYVLVGFALAADAFAVSVSAAACATALPLLIGIRAAFMFGFFQFLMPLVGWSLGSAFSALIQNYDHWIAFGLLIIVGSKMLYEAIHMRRESACDDPEKVVAAKSKTIAATNKGTNSASKGIMKLNTLLVLAFATSIDAMAVGLSYNLLGMPIMLPSFIIGTITFIVCIIGIEFGKRLRKLIQEWAEIGGGSILIIIGFRILIDHIIKGT